MTLTEYRRLEEKEIEPELFARFDRTQEVTRCWRKEEGGWVLKNIPFVDQWGPEEYRFLVECLRNTVRTGGAVWGAFRDGALMGFGSVESRLLGSRGQYRQLSSLHVSRESRGRGTGVQLFLRLAEEARAMDAGKLYISAHSAEETQGFYKKLGCVEAEEYDPPLTAAEPCDCQLEFSL